MEDKIIVRGARMHNLKNINVEIPHNALTVITGVSGIEDLIGTVNTQRAVYGSLQNRL